MTELQVIPLTYPEGGEGPEYVDVEHWRLYKNPFGTIPPFADFLYDIDCLFKVNRIGNGLDKVNDMNFKAAMAQEAIAKIEKLSKLVTGGHVSIHDIYMAGAIKDNIHDGSNIALVNTMALLDRVREQVRFMELKAAFRQTFAPPPQAHFMAKTPVGTMILRNMVGNTGATLIPRTSQRVGPGTPDPGIGLHITPRPGGTTQHPPTGVGTKITGQVLRQLASTSMAR